MSKSNKDTDSMDLKDPETLLVYAQLGVRLLKIEVTKLEQENARLRDELKDRVLNSQPQRSGSATDDDSDLEELSLRVSGREVESPKQRASKLEKENGRLREKIEDKRLLREVQTANAPGEEVDPLYRMRKLLRRFSDLMVVSTIVAGTCPGCFKPFKVKECSRLICGHLICHVCLPKISRAATRETEALRCIKCGRDTPRENLELVYMTEKGRWGGLTKVAQAWMAFDKRGEMETSEEEDEENFITDGTGTSEITSDAENNDDETTDGAPNQEQPEGSEQRQASPLLSTGASDLLFSDSPSKLKRKRMEKLAAERSQRQKRN